MKEIKTFEDACKITGDDSSKLPDVSMLAPGLAKFLIANFKLAIIAKALNEGWKPDWNNWDEYKYTPWFERNKDSSGFSYDFYRWVTGAIVGSRLYYRSSTLAKYAGQQFIELYNDLLQYED